MQVMQGLGVRGIQNNPIKNALYIKINFGWEVDEIVCMYVCIVIWNLDENDKNLEQLKFGQQFEKELIPENAPEIALKIAPEL